MHRDPLSSGLLHSAAADFWAPLAYRHVAVVNKQGPRVCAANAEWVAFLDVQLAAHFLH